MKLPDIKLICMGTVAMLLFLYLVGLGSNYMDYDEGAVYLYQNMLVSMGKIPYKDFYYHQMPGLLQGFTDVFTARMFTFVSLLSAVLGVYFLGKKFGVGWFAVVFLLSSPMVMQFGRVFVGEIPLLAVFTFFMYVVIDKGNKVLKPIIVGASIVCCVLIKIQIAIPIAVVILYMSFIKKDYDYLLAGFIALIIMALLFLVEYGMFEQAVLGNMGGYDAERAFAYTTTSAVIFLIKSQFMLPFFALGFYEAFVKGKRAGTEVLWIVISSVVITAISYSWLNFKHFMYVLPVMAVVAGIGLKSLKNNMLSIAVILVCLLVPLTEWKATMSDPYTMKIVNNITVNTASGDMIYTDQAMLAFLAKRQMPESALLFNGMGKVHGLNDTIVINDIKNGNPKMVLFVTQTVPDKMEGPRIYSTLGKDGAKRVLDYLGMNYQFKYVFRRDWQLIQVWSKEELK